MNKKIPVLDRLVTVSPVSKPSTVILHTKFPTNSFLMLMIPLLKLWLLMTNKLQRLLPLNSPHHPSALPARLLRCIFQGAYRQTTSSIQLLMSDYKSRLVMVE